MKQITFLGAAGTVTGSSYFLHDTLDNEGILVDLGMFQGRNEIEKWNFDTIPLHPQQLKGVLLTHAHLDHCGRLPLLRRFGYKGPIYMTEATRMITELTLRDSAKIAHEHFHGMTLYTEEDVEWTLKRSEIVPYDQPVNIDDYTVLFRNAGHILGSAFLEVYCNNQDDGVKRIIFSGDIGNYPEDLVKPTDFAREGDIVLIESTYGDKEHIQENPKQVLKEEIQAIEQSGGTLLLPAFSVERTQEILHHIDHLKRSNDVRQDTPVYLDSPLAIKVTHIYQQYRSLYNDELTTHAITDNPFDFPGLRMVQDSRESRAIMERGEMKVVIAGSGMMNGGRILRHAMHALPQEDSRILFVGYQAEGTLGRLILDGVKEVHINGELTQIRAHARKSSGMSSHADQPKLLKWLKHIQGVQKIFLVHGENPQRNAFAEAIKKEIDHAPTIYIPMKDQTFAASNEEHQFVLQGSSSAPRKKTKTPTYMPRMAILSA